MTIFDFLLEMTRRSPSSSNHIDTYQQIGTEVFQWISVVSLDESSVEYAYVGIHSCDDELILIASIEFNRVER